MGNIASPAYMMSNIDGRELQIGKWAELRNRTKGLFTPIGNTEFLRLQEKKYMILSKTWRWGVILGEVEGRIKTR